MLKSIPNHLLIDQRFHKTYIKHSVYNHTINFIADDWLISLHDDSRQASPMGVILDCDQSELKKIAENLSSILITDKAIFLDEKMISLSDVRQSQHNLLTLCAHQVLNQNQSHQLFHEITTIINHQLSKLNQYQTILAERITELQIALRSKHNLQTALKNLIGLGEGLTPSGDDVICGVMAGVLYQGNIDLFTRLATEVKKIFQLNKNATSIISKAFLMNAVEGWFIEDILLLFEKLIHNEPISDVITNIAALGHSSGKDFLRGILLGNLEGGDNHDL